MKKMIISISMAILFTLGCSDNSNTNSVAEKVEENIHEKIIVDSSDTTTDTATDTKEDTETLPSEKKSSDITGSWIIADPYSYEEIYDIYHTISISETTFKYSEIKYDTAAVIADYKTTYKNDYSFNDSLILVREYDSAYIGFFYTFSHSTDSISLSKCLIGNPLVENSGSIVGKWEMHDKKSITTIRSFNDDLTCSVEVVEADTSYVQETQSYAINGDMLTIFNGDGSESSKNRFFFDGKKLLLQSDVVILFKRQGS